MCLSDNGNLRVPFYVCMYIYMYMFIYMYVEEVCVLEILCACVCVFIFMNLLVFVYELLFLGSILLSIQNICLCVAIHV